MILTTHEPFLQSKAQMLLLPVSTDGNLAHPVVARCKSLFADNYDVYHKKAIAGELMLGQTLTVTLDRQITGLGVQTNSVQYIGNLVCQKFPEHPISIRMFERCLTELKPKLYELMRYQGVRRVALLGSALLIKTTTEPSPQVVWLTAQSIVQSVQSVLGDVPKLTVEIHFNKETELPILQKSA